MYEVEEIYAPDGYEKSDKTLTFKGKVINDTKENLIHDVKAENNTDNDTTTYVHDSDTLVNQKLDYIALKKIWDDHDNAAKIRPDVVTIKATHKTTKEVKVYTLTKIITGQCLRISRRMIVKSGSFVKMFPKVIL